MITRIRTVTQEEFKQKFDDFSQKILGKQLEQSDITIVSERKPSKISVIDNKDFLATLKEKGFSVPENMEDISVVSVINNSQKNTIGKKMKR
jgi:hypothetical protein